MNKTFALAASLVVAVACSRRVTKGAVSADARRRWRLHDRDNREVARAV